MIEPIIIRAATRADTAAIAHLWVSTFPDKFGPILGDKAEPILYDYLRLSEHHVQTTTVAESLDEVVGFMALKRPSSTHFNGGRWLWHALHLHQNRWESAWSFLKMGLVDNRRRVEANEVYIEMLGVAAVWRGRGLARRLLQHAEQVALVEAVQQISLNVVCDNAAAIEVYHKLGFELKRQQSSHILAMLTGHRGFYEMVKPIADENCRPH